MAVKDQIKDYFNQNWFTMMRDIARMVSINSERMPAQEGKPFGEGPYQALMEFKELAKERGFDTKIYGNAVGAVSLNDGPKQLDILAHLDVVPAGEDWTVTSPFDATIKDGRIYGRGTADDKGPAVVALWALKCVKDLGLPVSKNVSLLVGTDEECGSGDLPYYYNVEKEAPMSFSPDAEYPLINIEKGGMHPTFSASWEEDKTLPRVTSITGSLKVNVMPGKARADVEGMDLDTMKKVADQVTPRTKCTYELTQEGDTVKIVSIGVAAHASTPQNGVNALTGLIDYLLALPLAESEAVDKLRSVQKLLPHGDYLGKALGVAMEDQISHELTLCFSMMDFTTTGFTGQFDCRAPLCATTENLRDTAERNFAKEGITMEHVEPNEPHYVSGDSELVHELLSVYEDYTGKKGECLAIGGGTYVHHLKNGVAFGCSMPGTENHMHEPNESAVIEELIISAEMFAQVIADLCK